MDGVAKIRRASEQLRSVEEIQPWWGIPWSRVDRHFVAIDNRGARRIGERDNAASTDHERALNIRAESKDSVMR
jgi:hypothetical protein